MSEPPRHALAIFSSTEAPHDGAKVLQCSRECHESRGDKSDKLGQSMKRETLSWELRVSPMRQCGEQTLEPSSSLNYGPLNNKPVSNRGSSSTIGGQSHEYTPEDSSAPCVLLGKKTK